MLVISYILLEGKKIVLKFYKKPDFIDELRIRQVVNRCTISLLLVLELYGIFKNKNDISNQTPSSNVLIL